jgi:hypothetical protein
MSLITLHSGDIHSGTIEVRFDVLMTDISTHQGGSL